MHYNNDIKNRNDNMTSQLQKVELEILKQFLYICEKEHLRYYILGGTLLGAVRHKGFIPWDDDIDVGIPRKDYKKFLLRAPKYLPEYYFLQTYQTDPKYPYSFAKIRDIRTIYKEEMLSKLSINHGVWIDVFPLDYCATHHKWFDFQQQVLQKRISCVLNFRASLRTIFLQWISRILIPSVTFAVDQRNKLIQKFPKTSPLIANFCGAWGTKEIVPTEWYGEGASLTFEHLTVKGPLEYHKWLTQVYGDYMQLPPIEKRKCHHPAEIKL